MQYSALRKFVVTKHIFLDISYCLDRQGSDIEAISELCYTQIGVLLAKLEDIWFVTIDNNCWSYLIYLNICINILGPTINVVV